MAESQEDIEDRVEKAVEEILAEREAGEKPSVRQTAREWNVNVFRVYRRLKGIGPRTSRKPTNTKLSEVQERSLLQYILALDEIGQSLRYDCISSVANDMLKDSHEGDSSASIVDQYWAKHFLNRYSELHKAK